jgi:molybdopterin/thiamine biosynthesis adenylyltransferase/rhodanese-related sulfurtransferase
MIDGDGSQVVQIAPAEAARRLAAGAILLDVREPGEWSLGSPTVALRIALGALPAAIGHQLVDRSREVIALCASGRRSETAAVLLREAGWNAVASLAGGFAAWRAAGLGWEAVSALDADARERYARHLSLPQVGEAGQLRLLHARVLVAGVGGLGSPAALYLAAAGVGHLRLVDHDVVERSNLQRQVLHAEARIGQRKVDSAAVTLAALNPGIAIEAVAERIDAGNVLRLLEGVDVVLDGTDNFAARYVLDAACTRLRKPLVYAAIQRFEAQVGVFGASAAAPCYRCLFPDPPAAQDAPDCATAGVLGVLPGIAGCVQAAEALKLLARIGDPLDGRLLHIDVLGMHFRELQLPRDPACPGCGPLDGRRPPAGLGESCALR